MISRRCLGKLGNFKLLQTLKLLSLNNTCVQRFQLEIRFHKNLFNLDKLLSDSHCNQYTPQSFYLAVELSPRAAHTFQFIYLFGVLRHFQHCTGHITTGSWKGRGNQYIQLVRVLYCKLPTNGKQLPAFPLEAVPGI